MSEAAAGTALAERDDIFMPGAEMVARRMSKQMYNLVRATVAREASEAECAMFLELAAHYQLDPFAKEIWCFKGSGGIIIMVGRDGLRRIAHRNGLDMDGDVVRERDRFVVTRGPDRKRTIQHAYAEAREQDAARKEGNVTAEERRRGPIVGAWAEVWDKESGEQRGFFYAPMHEYRPTSAKKLEYSPWGSQESVMILAAAERQALRQATPLGGLLAEGEMDLNEERRSMDASTAEDQVALEAVLDGLQASAETRDRLYDAFQEANALSRNAWPSAKVQMALMGKDEEGLIREAEEVERANAEMRARIERARRQEEAKRQEQEPPEAEVVTPEERWVELTQQIVELERTLEDGGDALTPEARERAERHLAEMREELSSLPHPDAEPSDDQAA